MRKADLRVSNHSSSNKPKHPIVHGEVAHSASIKENELRDRVVMIRTNRNAGGVIEKLGVLPALGSFLLDINDDKKDE